MDRFKTVICTKSLTAFHEEVSNDNYFLIGVAGQNAAILAGSKKWLSIDPFVNEKEEVIKSVEEICHLFIKNYQIARLRKNPDSAEVREDDIIESLGILWLQKNGKCFIYQAGKSKFITLKMSGYTIESGILGALNFFELKDNDRLILDLKDADLGNFLKDFHDSQDAGFDNSAELKNFNYPFALTFIKLEKQIPAPAIPEVITVTEPVKSEILGEENFSIIENTSGDEFEPKEEKAILAEARSGRKYLLVSVILIVAIGILIGYRYFDLGQKFDNPGFAASEKEDPIFVSTPASNSSAGNATSELEEKESKILTEKEPAGEGLGKRTTHSSFLIDADFALKSANENLKNGRNQQAFIQLEKAEKAYLGYLSARPSEKKSIQIKLDEIRQKKSLINSETDF